MKGTTLAAIRFWPAVVTVTDCNFTATTKLRLLHGDAFGQVARFVDVAPAQHSAVVREELQRNYGEQRGEDFMVGGNIDHVVHQPRQVSVAGAGYGDDRAFAGMNLFDVGDYLLVGPVLRDDGHGWETGMDQGDRSMLHLPGGVSFSVNIGYFLELQGTLERDGIVIFATDVKEVFRAAILLRQCAHFLGTAQNLADLVRHPLEAAQYGLA